MFDEPMSKHTSWRLGGPADRYYIPADLHDLQNFLAGLEPDIDILWIGLGSNLLVRDGGFRGQVIAPLNSLKGNTSGCRRTALCRKWNQLRQARQVLSEKGTRWR